MKKTTQFIILAFALITGSFSCKKFVQVPLPGNLIVNTTVFADSASAIAAIAGLYTNMNSSETFLSGETSLYPGLSADELSNVSSSSTAPPFLNNALAKDNSTVASFWSYAYSEIFQANSIIEGLAASTSISPALRNQLIGEAKFCRAFIYFYLVNLYGAVPLELSTNYLVNQSYPRTSTDSVYAQIITDLRSAETILTPNYADQFRIRANQYAATAMLARVYLFRQIWAGADSAASAVLNSGTYYLEPNLNNVFLASSNEAIWQMQSGSTNFNTSEGLYFLPRSSSALPPYQLQPFLLNAFDSGDLRRSNWTKISGLYTYPYKFKVRISTSLTEYEVPLRLAEQYLIRAEARVQENTNIQGALQDIDTVRSRAGLGPITYTTNGDLLDSIYHENQVEFFTEWGHRWLDLKRTGLANKVLGAEKSGWQGTDTLYPVPVSQILINQNLTQNPGY